jgi:hypothetical protein
MADTYRVLLTGPRLWPDPGLLGHHLLIAGREALARGLRPVLVHGQCDPRHPVTRRPVEWRLAAKELRSVQRTYLGADWLAEWAAAGMSEVAWDIERHPADWEAPCRDACEPGHRRRRWDGTESCPAAGSHRNGDMAALGADVCLYGWMPCADPRHRSWRTHGTHGAADCAGKAERAGIPVRKIETELAP